MGGRSRAWCATIRPAPRVGPTVPRHLARPGAAGTWRRGRREGGDAMVGSADGRSDDGPGERPAERPAERPGEQPGERPGEQPAEGLGDGAPVEPAEGWTRYVLRRVAGDGPDVAALDPLTREQQYVVDARIGTRVSADVLDEVGMLQYSVRGGPFLHWRRRLTISDGNGTTVAVVRRPRGAASSGQPVVLEPRLDARWDVAGDVRSDSWGVRRDGELVVVLQLVTAPSPGDPDPAPDTAPATDPAHHVAPDPDAAPDVDPGTGDRGPRLGADLSPDPGDELVVDPEAQRDAERDAGTRHRVGARSHALLDVVRDADPALALAVVWAVDRWVSPQDG